MKVEVVDQLVYQVLGVTNTEDMKVYQLAEALEQCSHGPTIIFDVDCSSRDGVNIATVQAIHLLVLYLSNYCRCIIILSEANAILEFGRDSDIENYLYIDEMPREQGKQLLQERGAKFTQNELNFIFDNIGTRPMWLEKLADEVPGDKSLEQFVSYVLERAKEDLRDFPHKTMLQALVKQPDGVKIHDVVGPSLLNQG